MTDPDRYDEDTLAQLWLDAHDDILTRHRGLRIHLALHDQRDTRQIIKALTLLGHHVTEHAPNQIVITNPGAHR